jgi:putative inorganic carbon (hco3(-)) transporter
MPSNQSNKSDYQKLSSTAQKGGVSDTGLKTLKPNSNSQKTQPVQHVQSLTNPSKKQSIQTVSPQNDFLEKRKSDVVEPFVFKEQAIVNEQIDIVKPETELSYGEQQKLLKKEKRSERDNKLLNQDNWLVRNGHTFTYVGLYLFSVLVLFRPYELVPALGFLSATAFYFAAATLLIYLPTQFATEGNLTILTTEVKAVLALTSIALITMPIAKSPATAWAEFNDPFIKAVLIFIVMVNVIRTRQRLMGMMWLSISIGILLSYMALGMYMRGEMNIEDYRVSVKVGGMFENPNEMSIHLIMMIPLAISIGLASKNKAAKLLCFASAVLMLSANMVTFSRGGFLGLIAASAVLVWKLGRKNRVGVTVTSAVIGLLLILFAPGNFGLRILSIFIPQYDGVGSSNQRSELLKLSLIVSARNPWGIGIGNFPIVGISNLVSHNAYTQVSSELGVLGLIAYLIFIVSPLRKLSAIERIQFEKKETDWFYYLSIGLQASFVAYMVGSFFASIAYNWFVYYLIAYAVAFRRIYKIEKGLQEVPVKSLMENWGNAKTA